MKIDIRDLVRRYLNVREDDAVEVQRTRSLLLLLALILFVNAIGIVQAAFFASPFVLDQLILTLIAFAVFIALIWAARRGQRWTRYVFLAFLLIIIPLAFRDSLNTPAIIAFILPVAVAPLIAAPALAILMALVQMLVFFGLSQIFTFPYDYMTAILLALLGVAAWLPSSNLQRTLRQAQGSAQALADTNRELEQGRALLETRTADLERQTRYLEATTAVAASISTELNVGELLARIVRLISEQFEFYHAGIFLLDASGEWAELQAASSPGGQRMLARHHRLRVGAQGTVGYVTQHGISRVALDVGEDAVFFNNPDLPETHSAMTLPLRARGRIIGALDVQSKVPNAFTQEDARVMQSLADQVAVAISNARLFEAAQESLAAQQRAYGEVTREAWSELLGSRATLGYRSTQQGTRPLSSASEVSADAASGDSRGHSDGPYSDLPPDNQVPLEIPIRVSGEVIGVIDTHKPAASGGWTPEEVAAVESLSDRLAAALESARYYEDIQRRAASERLSREISAQMRASMDIDTVLQTTVRELLSALDLASIEVRLGAQSEFTRPGLAASDLTPSDLTPLLGGEPGEGAGDTSGRPGDKEVNA